MASNTNLAVARIAMAAISLTSGNRKKFSPYGSLQASRSPQNAALIAEMNPKNAKNGNRLSIISGQTTPQARVTLNYRPQETATVKTSRTVADGDRPTDATALNVDYTLHREEDYLYLTTDLMRLEKETEAYLKQVNAGNLSVNISGFQLLSDMGDNIMKKADYVLQNINTVIATALVAGAGGNLMLGPSANTGVPTIQGFNTDGSVNPYVWDWLTDLMQIHQFEGKAICVGGAKWQRYFNRKKIASAASLGFDYAKLFELLDVEFYYDPSIDTLSGQDHLIVMDAGSFCMETIMEHELIENGGVLAATKVANTTYGTASLSVANTAAPTFTLDHDIRVREQDTAYPKYTITPSIHFGTFAKPAGFTKNYDGWETVTGIFRVKIL
ncbi:hypothetical protein GCM10028808_73320 [Spirosoma migulaei]